MNEAGTLCVVRLVRYVLLGLEKMQWVDLF